MTKMNTAPSLILRSIHLSKWVDCNCNKVNVNIIFQLYKNLLLYCKYKYL